MTEIQLERLAWPQVKAALADGYTTVVFACGATEQHGPHLPLLVDAEIGTRTALETARRLGKALVAPTLRVGCSDHHMAFPGTLSLRRDTFDAVVEDYCTSLARHGLQRLCIFPSHGGNVMPLAELEPRLRETLGDSVEVVVDTDLMGLMDVWKRGVPAAGGPEGRVGGHADIAEGSILMTITPELVQEEKAEEGYMGELSREDLDRVIREGLHTVTPNGILGDGRGMSSEIGEYLVARMAERLVEVFAA
ncbi:MAG: creatininase family protein [Gemmatimonadetes bacterium]|nr:creatininase family protein [Gemmatimonadota bacterium]